MKLSKRFGLAVLGACMALSLTAVGAACTKTPAEPTYAVTYAFGSCGDTAYAGDSTLPTEAEKKEGEKFDLAGALVWEGYTFTGWNDGETIYEAGAEYEMPAHAVTLTAQWEEDEVPAPTYAVTYALGRCNGADYAGTTDLPTEAEKEGNAKFKLAAAPVWENHSFMGWSDGTKTYAAGAEYTMPDKAVTLTAQWSGYVELVNRNYPTWNEGATTGGYEIVKGQQITISAYIYKQTGDSAYGINAKIFPSSAINSNGTFYQFRCDFAVKRTNNSWREDNYGFNVDEGGFVRDTYRQSEYGDVEITVALSEEGVLTYTFVYVSDSYDDYSHRRVFTDTVKMNSAYVIFGFDHAELYGGSAYMHLTYPASNERLVTLDTNCDDSDWTTMYEESLFRYAVPNGDTYTITDYSPTRIGYEFLGWQVNGEGAYYQKDDTIPLGKDSVTLVAAWRQAVTITIDKNGAERNPSVVRPTYAYDEETGKYVISGLPGVNEYTVTKKGYRYDGWQVTVNGEEIEVDGPFSVDPGAVIVFTIRWVKA